MLSLVLVFVLVIVCAVCNGFVWNGVSMKPRRTVFMSSTEESKEDPRYQALVDRIKQDPSFNACINPDDRAIFMANVPEKLRSIDNTLKRLAGVAMHPTKGISSIPDIDETLKKMDNPIGKALSSPKSNFMRSPTPQDDSNREQLRRDLIEQLTRDGQQIPSVFEN